MPQRCPFSWRRLAGTIVAVLGIGVVSGLGTGEAFSFSLLGIGAMVAAAVSIAAGAVVVKVFPPAPGPALNAIGMAVGAVLLSALLDAEPRTPSLVAGGLLVAAGAYAALHAPKRRNQRLKATP